MAHSTGPVRAVDSRMMLRHIDKFSAEVELVQRKLAACAPTHRSRGEEMSGHPVANIHAMEAADPGPEGKYRRDGPGML